MKKLFLAFLALVSLQAFADEFNGFRLEPEEFDAALSRMSLSSGETTQEYNPYFWRTSAVACNAATICPNGRRIWCRAYGFNYSSVPSHMNNSCRWMVLPGRAVRCQGYSLQRDFYGRTFWAYVDIPVSCY